MLTRREALKSALAAIPAITSARIEDAEPEPLCIVLEMEGHISHARKAEIIESFADNLRNTFPDHPICDLPVFLSDAGCKMRIERRPA